MSRHVAVLEALSVWVVVGHSAVSPRWRKLMGQFATRALEDAPGRQGGHQLGSRVPRCFSDDHYPFFPVTAPLRLVAASNGQCPNPFLCLVVLPPPALGAPKPMPTSWGGAEERAAGGGTVVPGRQLHAVA